MSNQPPYGQPPGGGYPPPGGYQGGGYPPPGPPTGKTQVLGLDYNIAGLLCYLPVCCVPLIASILWLMTEPRENKLLRFHALQSLLLSAVGVIIGVVFWFLGLAMAVSSTTTVGAAGSSFLSLIMYAIGTAFLVVVIIGMIKAYKGEMWKIPVIGDIADKNT